MIDAYKAGVPGNDESFASQHLELAEVELVDREAVKLLTQAEAEGIELRSCPAYIREWVANERETS